MNEEIESAVEHIVFTTLKRDIDNLQSQLDDTGNWHHPDDVKGYKKDLKAYKRVLKCYDHHVAEAALMPGGKA